MSAQTILPVLLLGFLFGFATKAMVDGQTPSIGEILNLGVTLFVGWSIQRTLGRRNELDRVPIESVARLCERIEDLILECIRRPSTTLSTDPALLQTLTILSNEIVWLKSLAEAVGADTESHRELRQMYFRFKEQLTGGKTVNLSRASETARSMRTSTLISQWHIRQRILDEPDYIDTLTASRLSDPRMGPRSRT